MKSNDIELIFRSKGAERGAKECVHQLAEEINDMRKTIQEMGKAFASLATVQTMLTGALDGMEAKMKAMAESGEQSGSTRGLLS